MMAITTNEIDDSHINHDISKEGVFADASIRIAIASGKGGTGKTLLSTSLFHMLQQQHAKVTLVDCDAEEPNDMLFFSGKMRKSVAVKQWVPVIDESKCTFCGLCHDYCNYNAIFILPPAKVIKVIEDLCHGCGACAVACSFEAITGKEISLGNVIHYEISESSNIVESRVRAGIYSPVSVIRKAIKESGNEHIVLLDAPPGTSCPFIHTVYGADYVILVTEPTPFGLSDLKQSVETLRTMSKPCGVIVNKGGLGDRQVYSYLMDENIPLLMEIPFDRKIASSYARGDIRVITAGALGNKLLQVFYHILDKYGNSHHQR